MPSPTSSIPYSEQVRQRYRGGWPDALASRYLMVPVAAVQKRVPKSRKRRERRRALRHTVPSRPRARTEVVLDTGVSVRTTLPREAFLRAIEGSGPPASIPLLESGRVTFANVPASRIVLVREL